MGKKFIFIIVLTAFFVVLIFSFLIQDQSKNEFTDYKKAIFYSPLFNESIGIYPDSDPEGILQNYNEFLYDLSVEKITLRPIDNWDSSTFRTNIEQQQPKRVEIILGESAQFTEATKMIFIFSGKWKNHIITKNHDFEYKVFNVRELPNVNWGEVE